MGLGWFKRERERERERERDLLQSVSPPAVRTYGDDCTLSWTYERGEAQAVVVQSANALLSDMMACWGVTDRWQVKFVPDKTQAMGLGDVHAHTWTRVSCTGG